MPKTELHPLKPQQKWEWHAECLLYLKRMYTQRKESLMELTANNNSLTTQDKVKFYNFDNDVEKENLKSAESASQKELLQDRVEIRNSYNSEVPSISDMDLNSILSSITTSLNSNESTAVLAQGNLTPSSVLALLDN